MNCNAVELAGFFCSGLMSYRPVAVVCRGLMALLSFSQIDRVRPRLFDGNIAGFLCYALTLHNIVFNGLGAIVGIFCHTLGFQPFISPLHSNSGYDMPVRIARILIGLFAPYWFIIPAIAVQRAYKRLKTNKNIFIWKGYQAIIGC